MQRGEGGSDLNERNCPCSFCSFGQTKGMQNFSNYCLIPVFPLRRIPEEPEIPNALRSAEIFHSPVVLQSGKTLHPDRISVATTKLFLFCAFRHIADKQKVLAFDAFWKRKFWSEASLRTPPNASSCSAINRVNPPLFRGPSARRVIRGQIHRSVRHLESQGRRPARRDAEADPAQPGPEVRHDADQWRHQWGERETQEGAEPQGDDGPECRLHPSTQGQRPRADAEVGCEANLQVV